MKQKVQRISTLLAETISAWKTVDSITLADSAYEEIYDPYFYISLDIYYDTTIPSQAERKDCFPDSIAFETGYDHKKDRFLLEELPVRLEYKEKITITEMLQNPEEHLGTFSRIGTYGLYRLENADLLYAKSSWLDDTKALLHSLPDSFWLLLRTAFRASMAHALSDLKAATLRNDNYFFVTSSASFVRKLISLLFVENRLFEPSGRHCFRDVFLLNYLPENFRGRLESFLRQDGSLDVSKKAEIASLLAKSVVSMG